MGKREYMWQYLQAGKVVGPVDADTIEELLKKGTVNELTLVRRDAGDEWKHLDETDLILILQDLVADTRDEQSIPVEPPPLQPQGEISPVDRMVWYYMLDGKTFGPLSSRELLELRDHGIINVQTPILENGSTDWKPLRELEWFMSDRQVGSAGDMAGQGLRQAAINVDPVKLKRLFILWGVLYSFTIVYLALLTLAQPVFFKNNPVGIGFSFLVELPVFAAIILEYILFYRFWQLIQDGYVGISPGQAVGYMFIPVFNFYWIFRVYIGLSKEFNRFIDRHFREASEVRRAHPYISISYLFITIIEIIALLFAWINTIFSMASSPTGSPHESYLQQFSTPFLAIYVLLLVVRLIMFADYYFTAQSILEVQGVEDE